MEHIILIRYGELMTKGENKKLFQGRLLRTIMNRLERFDVKIIKTRDRIYIENLGAHFDEVNNELQTVFGIHSYSLAVKVDTDIEVMKEAARVLFKDIKNQSIRVETKRSDKSFPIKSMDVSREVASAILRTDNNLTVNLRQPDQTLIVEVRHKHTYLMFKKITGAKGYPTGSVGSGLLMLSGGIDSPVAGHLVMKRGIEIEAIHFASPPYTSEDAKNKVLELARQIARFSPNQKMRVHVVPFTNMQIALHKAVQSSYEMTVMRRMMYRISEQLMRKQKLTLLVNGECLGQVASQTPQSMETVHRVVTCPVIQPLITYDKEEVVEISQALGFYDTSILPYEDCCTIFVPKKPATKPKYFIAEQEEAKFEWEPLLEEALQNIETVEVDFNGVETNNEFDDLFA